MSVVTTRQGGIQPPEKTALTTTNATTIYTAASGFPVMLEMILLANTDNANNCEVTLAWNDGSNDQIFWFTDVFAAETQKIEVPLFLEANPGIARSLKATAQNANDITVTVIVSSVQRQEYGQ